jgi:hypothetical protein
MLFFTSSLLLLLLLLYPRKYELILSTLNVRTLYSRRRHLDALFLVNVFKGKINCNSIMDAVGLRVPARQVREFCTFSVNSARRHSPSARCVIAANDVCKSLELFGINIVSHEGTFSIREMIWIGYLFFCISVTFYNYISVPWADYLLLFIFLHLLCFVLILFLFSGKGMTEENCE